MGDSSTDSVSIDMETMSFAGKVHLVKTSHGCVSVAVVGDQDKPAMITYPDLALNYMSCFQGLFYCQEASSMLVHNFCIYHVSSPGHEVCHWCCILIFVVLIKRLLQLHSNASSHMVAFIVLLVRAVAMSPDKPMLCADDLVDQILEVLVYFGLGSVMCMGVTAGAYILTLFAMKYSESCGFNTDFSSMQSTILDRMFV